MGGKKKSRPGQAGGASAHLAESSSLHSHHSHTSSEGGDNHAMKMAPAGSSSDVAINVRLFILYICSISSYLASLLPTLKEKKTCNET